MYLVDFPSIQVVCFYHSGLLLLLRLPLLLQRFTYKVHIDNDGKIVRIKGYLKRKWDSMCTAGDVYTAVTTHVQSVINQFLAHPNSAAWSDL